ncbi:uncharacterized protein [Odocoileus virginianus]|uniref:Uncharacterized protein isoform X1 n=2 Tax=Odocoileus virginianus TaxID=9874 RepID=A0ABM4HFU1_ODOVR
MGQGESTPLSLMTDHFPDVRARAHNLSLSVKKSKLTTFCSAEWPTLQVGWTPEGTFQPSIIQAVKEKIMAPDPWGHPDQVPYIVVWQDLVENPPNWLKPFVHRTSNPQVLVMELTSEETKKKESSKPVFQDASCPNLIDLETEARPPPYVPPLEPPGGGEGSGRAARGDHEGGPALGTRGRTRGDRSMQDPGDPELPSSTVQALPVRVGPANPSGERTYQYWPFSTSDLYNWKTQNPPFSEKPQGLIDLLDSILFTHNPTWDDCQQLLQVLFTTEERERILAEARKRVPGVDGRPTAQPHLVDEGFPLLRPNWDFEQAEGRERLRVYRQTLMAGLRAAARKPTNLAKVNLVRQEPTESPAAFLERLMEAFRQYTPINPQADESRAAVILAFVNQAAPDIRRKLQKIEGLGEQTIQDLLKAAEKVFNNRETAEEREERIRREERELAERIRKEDREYRTRENQKNQKELAKILFAGMRTGSGARELRGRQAGKKEKLERQTLKKDQCAYCKELGHWKTECSKRDSRKGMAQREKVSPENRALYMGEDSD